MVVPLSECVVSPDLLSIIVPATPHHHTSRRDSYVFFLLLPRSFGIFGCVTLFTSRQTNHNLNGCAVVGVSRKEVVFSSSAASCNVKPVLYRRGSSSFVCSYRLKTLKSNLRTQFGRLTCADGRNEKESCLRQRFTIKLSSFAHSLWLFLLYFASVQAAFGCRTIVMSSLRMEERGLVGKQNRKIQLVDTMSFQSITGHWASPSGRRMSFFVCSCQRKVANRNGTELVNVVWIKKKWRPFLFTFCWLKNVTMRLK